MLFYWPKGIVDVLDVASNRLTSIRDATEENLRQRITLLEKKIAASVGTIDILKKKETLSQDEISKANAVLDSFQREIQDFNDEAENILE